MSRPHALQVMILLVLFLTSLPLSACTDAGSTEDTAAETAQAEPDAANVAIEKVSTAIRVGKPQPLAIEPDGYHARYSPDGRSVAYASQVDNKPYVWIAPSGGGEGELLDTGLTGDCYIDWHPAGGAILFDAYLPGTDGPLYIYSVNLDGSGLRQISNRNEPAMQPLWSPDGGRIICTRFIGKGISIWTMDADGGDYRKLTSGSGNAWHPACSPDGKWITYTSDVTGNSDIWIMPLKGGDPVQLTDSAANDDRSAWSPDSRWIAFVSDRAGSNDIWIIPASGGNAVQATTGSGHDSCPCWAPDGGSILYSSPDGFMTVAIEYDD